MKRKTYKTNRLILRPYKVSDYATWFNAYVNRLPARNRFDKKPFDPKKCTKREYKKIIERHKKLAQKDSTYIYGVFLKNSGVLVGAIDIFVICRETYGAANLGYQIHNRYWGKGYASEAVRASFQIAFEDLNLHRLEAVMDIDNKSSEKVARKSKMHKEGIKKHYWFQDDGWADQLIYAITPEMLRGFKHSVHKV